MMLADMAKRKLSSEEVIDLTYDAHSSRVAASGKEENSIGNSIGVATAKDVSPEVIDLTSEASWSSSSSISSNTIATQKGLFHQSCKNPKTSKAPRSRSLVRRNNTECSTKNASKIDEYYFREMNLVKNKIMRNQQRLWPNCPIELYHTGDLQLGHGIRSKDRIDPGTFVASYPSIVEKCCYNSKFAATYQVSLDRKKKLCHSPDVIAMKKMKTDKVPVIGTIVPPLAVFVNGSKSKEDANSVLYQLSVRSRVGSRNTMFLKIVKKVQPGEQIRWYYGEDYNF
mmetsp:Transcript_12683/g.17628  ORF Transcript_12683/g.17628 Transcript_12683/m.17628 type:complete len:283 (-) Transcript_12683:263-1111(-)